MAAVPAGTAPATPPAGGFGIDGDLIANTPTANLGDWLPGAGGTGGAVLDALGLPLVSATTLHRIDAYHAGDDVFTGGKKLNDNPGTWTWQNSAPNDKCDINHFLYHVAEAADGHFWLAVSADRLKVEGASYLDFELLQKTLTKNVNGTFSTAGPDGGRTINDLLLTFEFNGTTANLSVARWQSTGPGTFAFVDATGSLPSGSAFGAINAGTISVPYGAFGNPTYVAGQFGEFAVDLTSLLAGLFDPCVSVGIQTVLAKTKTANSASANLEDFVAPAQVNYAFGFVVDAGKDISECGSGAPTTDFALQGDIQGTGTIQNIKWEVVPGSLTGGVTAVAFADPNNPVTTATVTGSSGSVKVRLSATQSGCPNPKTDEVLLTIGSLGATYVVTDVSCHGANDGAINLTTTGGVPPLQVSWSNGASSEDLTGLGGGTYSVTVTDANQCSITLSNIPVAEPTRLEASSSATEIKCFGEKSTITVSATGGTQPYAGTGDFPDYGPGTYEFVVTDANGCTSKTSVTITQPDLLEASSSATEIKCFGEKSTITVSATGGTKPYTGTGNFTGYGPGTYEFVVTDAKNCTSKTSVTITQPDLLEASSSATEIQCFGEKSTITVSATGGTKPYTGTGDFTGYGPGTYEFVVTDAKGCTSKTSVTITQPDALDALANFTPILCHGGSSTVTVSATGGTGTYGGTGNFTRKAGQHTFVVTDANGCTDSVTITVPEPPALSATLQRNGGLICLSDPEAVAEFEAAVVSDPLYTSYEWQIEIDHVLQPLDGNTPGVLLTSADNGATLGLSLSIDFFKALNPAPDPLTGAYKILLTIVREDCGDQVTVETGVFLAECDTFCTLTQGFYGNQTGAFLGVRGTDLVPQLLGATGLTVGLPGQSFTIKGTEAKCLVRALPSGSRPRALPKGDNGFNLNCGVTVNALVDKQGKFDNVLLGQTITLALNIRLDEWLLANGQTDNGLPQWPLGDGYFCTVDDAGNLRSYSLPPAVMNALLMKTANPKVTDLLDLANAALGNGQTYGARPTDINAAVTTINEAFDDCSSVVDPCPTPEILVNTLTR